MRVLLTLSVFGIGLFVPALAQQKDTAASPLAQQLEASGKTSDEGFNKGDTAAIAWRTVRFTASRPLRNGSRFRNVRFSSHLTKVDQKVPPLLSKAVNEAWWFVEWSIAVQGKDDGPVQ
jgi:hypothetical protein